MPVERVPAVICDITSIKNGRYVEMPGWDPNFIVIDEKLKVSRVNLIGVITLADSQGTSASYTLTDGTGEISLRSYDSGEIEAKPGELVLIVGRPRSYQNEIYIVPELIRTVGEKWAAHRKKHLEILSKQRSALPVLVIEESSQEPETPHEPPKQQSPEPNKNDEGPASDTERIYAMIESLDSGDGVDISDVLSKAESEGIEKAEKAIHHMLEMGDIFEIRAGKLKVL